MKKLKNILIVALLTVVMAVNAACGSGSSFDASEYAESFMSMLTQGDVSAYTLLAGIPEDEALEEYQSMADTMKSFISVFGVSEETQERVTNAYLNIISQVKYTVHEAEKTEIGYDVDIEIQPIVGLYDGLMEELQEDLWTAYFSDEMSQEEFYDSMVNKIADQLEEKADSLSYGDPQTITLHFVKSGDSYQLENKEELGKTIGKMVVEQFSLTD